MDMVERVADKCPYTDHEIKRFWNKVESLSEEGCWLWRGVKKPRGYGSFQLRRRTRAAHRVAFEIANGTILDGLFVCHHCDNPACVNPSHLFLGSHSDNMADMMRKGRHVRPPRNEDAVRRARGSDNNFSKIDEDMVRKIRAMSEAGESSKAIAALFGIHRTNVWLIATRKTWKHVDD